MDRNGGKDRLALRRIVALLVAFAALADRAGTRPRPVRVAVLWFLRIAESVAWDFVIAVASEAGVGADFDIPSHALDTADDAGRLARSFTALAELLSDIVRRNPSPPPDGQVGDAAAHLMRTLRILLHAPSTREHLLPDTS